MIYVPMVIALLSWTDAFAGAKTYGATKPYTYEQQMGRKRAGKDDCRP